MKIRSGFVSNSSSSSFLIYFKGTKNSLSDYLKKVFAINFNDTYPLKISGKEIASTLEKNINDIIKTDEDLNYYIANNSIDENTVCNMRNYLNKGYSIFSGQLCSDSEPLEALLCDKDIAYEDDNLIIDHEGGY